MFRRVAHLLRGLAARDKAADNLAQSVKREKLTYLSEISLLRLEEIVRSAVTQSEDGDVLEFGVALGGTSIVLADIARKAGRSFHGFDVFAMIPEPSSPKDDEVSKERYRVIASGKSEGIGDDLYYGYRKDLYGEVVDSFARHQLPVDNQHIFLHKGLFEETVPNAPIVAIAAAHIDCDWYDPIRYCLAYASGKLVRGGVIIIDDYHTFGGCRTATDEFISTNPDFEFVHGPSVVLRKR